MVINPTIIEIRIMKIVEKHPIWEMTSPTVSFLFFQVFISII